MIWKENSTMIIALTSLDGEKCPIYLPIGVGQSKEYGSVKVVNMGTRHIRDAYDSTLLMITKDGNPIRTILHIIFFAWPDKETPVRPTEIIHFIDDINFNRNILMKNAQNKGWLTDTSKSPIIIHCKSGLSFLNLWSRCYSNCKICNDGAVTVSLLTVYNTYIGSLASAQKCLLLLSKADYRNLNNFVCLFITFDYYYFIGVGRSGALTAIDICARKLDDTFKRGNPAVDVRDTVLRLRTQREMAVQKPEQYLFIHLSVFEYAIRKRYFESVEDVQLDLFLYRKTKK